MDYENKFPHPNQFVSSKELEKLTGLTARFWDRKRLGDDGPPFIEVSKRAVRYKWGDVQQWMGERLRTGTKDQEGKKN